MQDKMYEYFYRLEGEHWWFQARKEIVIAMVGKFFRAFRDVSLKEAERPRILDIGCGTGMMLRELARYGEVWGIDKEPKAVLYASKKAPEAKVIKGSFPEAKRDSTSLEAGFDLARLFGGEKFDLVTALDVLEHLDNDAKALEAIAELLKPAGVAVITVPALSFLWTGHDNANRHKRRYTAGGLERKIKAAGLRPLRISYYNTLLFLPSAVAKIFSRTFFETKRNGKSYKTHLEDGLPPAMINKILKLIFSSEKYLLPCLRFPIGVSVIAIVTSSQSLRKYPTSTARATRSQSRFDLG